MIANRINKFFQNVTRWSAAQVDILALALVGSHARGTASDTSDIDLVFITLDPQIYLNNFDWVEQFGKIAKTQIESYGLVTSIRVWYCDGLEVEYGFTDKSWVAEPLDAGTCQVIHDGLRILFERNNILSSIQAV